MAKRILSALETFELRQALQVATLDALLASRRWEPGELIFQGGTSLHLVHGSPRYSEDLDFLVSDSLKLGVIADAVRARLEGTMWTPADMTLSVTKARDAHNPHAFDVALSGPNVIGSVRVKVELWKTPATVLHEIKIRVAPVRIPRGQVAGLQTFAPTADLSEIYADKVFALGARPYLKPRDVFDLYWLKSQHDIGGLSHDAMRVRLAIYPNETPEGWIERAQARRAELATSDKVSKDLKRWLPSFWPLDEMTAKRMCDTAITELDRGIELMLELVNHPKP